MVSDGQREELDGQLELIAREDVAPKFPEPEVFEAPFSGFANFLDVRPAARTMINMRNKGRVIE